MTLPSPTEPLARRFLDHITRDQVDESLDAWVPRKNQADAVIIALLAVAERDEVYRDHGYAGLRPYCMEKLGISKPMASLRACVARASLIHPEIIDDLETQALFLSSVRKIAPYLTPGPAGAELIAATRYKTGSQIDAMLDERFPDARSHRFDKFQIKMLSDGRTKIEMTVPGAVADKLQLAREIARNTDSDNTVATILEQALDEWIARRSLPESHQEPVVEVDTPETVEVLEHSFALPTEPSPENSTHPATREVTKHRLFTAVLLLGYPQIEAESRTRYALQQLGFRAPLGHLLAAALQPNSALRTRHATLPPLSRGSQVKEETVGDTRRRHPPGA